MTVNEFNILTNLPLDVKIIKTRARIKEFVTQYGLDGIYVAFSGGKDSTVLLHLVRSLYPEAKGMFCNTGLEYPEIVEFVKTIENIDIARPKISFKQVLEKYGYPVVSKVQSQYIHELKTTKSDKLRNIRTNGNKWGLGKVSAKWMYLIDAPFQVSSKCCDVMKKNPAKQYEKTTGRFPIIGTMAQESNHRKMNYLKFGCNVFESDRPHSNPLSFWTDKDVWEYISINGLTYASIYDKGYSRTGCMFCMYGLGYDEYEEGNRFQKMKITHPKIHDYCMNTLGIKEVLQYMNIETEPQKQMKINDYE